jgi:hypothetical protein
MVPDWYSSVFHWYRRGEVGHNLPEAATGGGARVPSDKTTRCCMNGRTSSLPILVAAVPASLGIRVVQDSGDAFSIGVHESGNEAKEVPSP